jgi:DNA uptake protein ComE-like DNA-binding protein
MHKLFREFLLLSLGERRGLLTLIVLLVITVSMFCGYHIGRRGTQTPTDTVAAQARREFMAALTAAPTRTPRSVATPPTPTPNAAAPRPQRVAQTGKAPTPILHRAPEPTAPRPTRYVRAVKYSTVTLIDLNSADTTELKKIPGIGSALSRRIVNYRNRLGGYSSAQQLWEIGLDTVQLDPWFTVSAADIHGININTAGVGKLMSHPYIDFYQAKAIVDCRKRNGPFHSLAPLALYDEFPPEKLERLRPYVRFE